MKFVKRIALVACLTMTLCSAARADQGKYTVYGPGTKSCGAWLADRRANNWYMEGFWVLGFVSGYGYNGPQLRHTDGEAIAAWVDNYCQSHPLDQLSVAAGSLVEALTEKAK